MGKYFAFELEWLVCSSPKHLQSAFAIFVRVHSVLLDILYMTAALTGLKEDFLSNYEASESTRTQTYSIIAVPNPRAMGWYCSVSRLIPGCKS